MTGYERDLNRVRCAASVWRVEELFPGAGGAEQAQFRTGRAKLPNLYLNTGQWYPGRGSAKRIARIMSGRAPEAEFAFRE